jgi:glutathione synthase/RimK-type ligase-like ATP-grasp enzyme
MTHGDKILLWGPPTDCPLQAVRRELLRIGCEGTFVDQELAFETEINFAAGAAIEGQVRVNRTTIDLSKVKSVYLRPDDPRDLAVVAETAPNSKLRQHALAVHDILISWADLTPALVINRPADMAANGSKPYQTAWIESLGFRTPETLLTTDPTATVEFWKQHGCVIYKSLSGIRSIVSQLTPEHLQRLEDITSCPTQFQEYVPGIEYRVHVIGDKVFACRILAQADDYRYSADPVNMLACSLPDSVSAQCRKLVVEMNLAVAGIDLRCTPVGDWYCLEVNPAPGFTYFQDVTGQPIAAAVAHLLADAPLQNCSVS